MHGREVGLVSKRGTNRLRYAPTDSLLKALVLATVPRRAEYKDFLASLFSRYGLVFARTSQEARRSRGFSMFVVPNGTPGMDIRPITSLTGHPAVAVPNGFTAKGTPTGMVFVGRLYREGEMLLLAKAYQERTRFYLRTPPGVTP